MRYAGQSSCGDDVRKKFKTPADVDETAVQLEEVVRLRAEIVTLRGQVGELELKVEELEELELKVEELKKYTKRLEQNNRGTCSRTKCGTTDKALTKIKGDQAKTKTDLRNAKKELTKLQASVDLDSSLRDKLHAKTTELKGTKNDLYTAKTAHETAEAALSDALHAKDKVEIELELVKEQLAKSSGSGSPAPVSDKIFDTMKDMAEMVKEVAVSGFSSMSTMGTSASGQGQVNGVLPASSRYSSPDAILARLGPNLDVEKLAKGATQQDLAEILSKITNIGDRIAVREAISAAGTPVN